MNYQQFRAQQQHGVVLKLSIPIASAAASAAVTARQLTTNMSLICCNLQQCSTVHKLQSYKNASLI
jgi:hypothetical protein